MSCQTKENHYTERIILSINYSNPMDSTHMMFWFEIAVTDLDRAATFYNAAFGVDFTDMNMGPANMKVFPMKEGDAGATGALVQAPGYTPSNDGSVLYVTVPSIDDTMEKITAAGGKELMPKMSIGEHGHIAHFEDTEGNRLAVHMMPEQA